MSKNLILNGLPIMCSQHMGRVPATDPGHLIISEDRLRKRWICSDCHTNNLAKLATLFGLDPQAAQELSEEDS